MVIKLVVGELRQLHQYSGKLRSLNGFYGHMVALKWRTDDDSGELVLDIEDIAKLRRYARSGYKKRVLRIFARTLGDRL
jgi:hypothetical protein